MATRDPNLPEGTDTIIAGASTEAEDVAFQPDADLDRATGGEDIDFTAEPEIKDVTGRASADGGIREQVGLLRAQAGERAGELKGQAGDKARSFVEQGRDRATEALDNVAKMIGDVAGQVEEKVGGEYGGYARRAADAVTGLSTTIRDKDVDELFDDAREFVRKSPGVALGVAAVVGFALVRLVKSGLPDEMDGTTGAGDRTGGGNSGNRSGERA